jgi:uncharacterized membrane protein
MNDQRLENIIGNLLRAGVLLAAVTVSCGGVVYLFHHAADQVSYQRFSEAGQTVRSIGGVIRAAAHLNSEGLIQLGLIMLIATPVARVALAVVGFALERDGLYATVSLVVLAILAFSLLHAL